MTQIDDDIKRGAQTAEGARLFREDTRWKARPGDAEREREIEEWLARIDDAMRPLRRLAGQLGGGWIAVTPARETRLRAVTRDLGYQRKQLKKMRRRT